MATLNCDLFSELLDEEDRAGKVEGVACELQRQLALLGGGLIPEGGFDGGEQSEQHVRGVDGVVWLLGAASGGITV